MYLFVGDLHIQRNNLADTELLFQEIKRIATGKATHIVFLGDVFHTHNVLKQEDIYAAKALFRQLSDFTTIVLAGNHDGSQPHSVKYNAVEISLKDIVTHVVIDEETPFILDQYAFLPFIGDNDQFVKAALKAPDKTLVCHQTFIGSTYENLHTAPGGVDQRVLPHKKIISGHIHLAQTLNKGNVVYYVGTPRHLTASDANTEKFIVFDDEEMTKHRTDIYCKRYMSKTVEVTDTVEIDWREKDKAVIVVKGTREEIDSFYEKNPELANNASIVEDLIKNFENRLEIQDSTASLDDAFKEYVFKVTAMSDEKREKVWEKLKTRV